MSCHGCLGLDGCSSLYFQGLSMYPLEQLSLDLGGPGSRKGSEKSVY